jgi:serine/threonine protein phosphatase PrpC
VAIQNLSGPLVQQQHFVSQNGSSAELPAGAAQSSSFVFCAIFDGHGGTSASTHAAERIQHMVSHDHHVMLKGLGEGKNRCS